MRTARYGCRAWRARLLALVDGTLTPTERELVERHVEECAACHSALEFEQLVEEGLHRDVGVDFDSEFEDRIAAGVARGIAQADNRRSERTSISRWKWVAAIVVCSTVGFAIASRFRPNPKTEEVAHSPEVAKTVDTTPIAENTPTENRRTDDQTTDPNRPTQSTTSLDPIEVERLSAARSTIREALLAAAASDGFALHFTSATESLARERWPIDALVRGAIEDPDPAVARAAITAVHEFSIRDALPAVRRAVRRPEVAPTAYLALGDLKDSSALPSFELGLRNAATSDAACLGLSRLGTDRAAQLLAEQLDDPRLFEHAIDALIAMNEVGIARLIVRADRGNVAIAAELMRRGLPTNRQLETLLTSTSEATVLAAAIRIASTRGTGSLRGLLAVLGSNEHEAATIDALVAIGGRSALAGIVAAADRGAIDSRTAGIAVLRILAGTLDLESTLRDSSRSANGATFIGVIVSALTAGCSPPLVEQGVHSLDAIVADDQVTLRNRMLAASWLAENDRFESEHALALVGAAWLTKDADAIVTSWITAGLAGVDVKRRDLPNSDVPEIDSILERAMRLGDRWRSSGSEPSSNDRSILVQRFQRVMP